MYVKTFRCDLLANGVIQAYVPEETDLYSTKTYLLYITVRTLICKERGTIISQCFDSFCLFVFFFQKAYNWGVQVKGPSAIRWTRMSTSKEGNTDYYQEG